MTHLGVKFYDIAPLVGSPQVLPPSPPFFPLLSSSNLFSPSLSPPSPPSPPSLPLSLLPPLSPLSPSSLRLSEILVKTLQIGQKTLSPPPTHVVGLESRGFILWSYCGFGFECWFCYGQKGLYMKVIYINIYNFL